MGGGQERVPWKGVAGEERVEERGWAYRRRQPEGTVLYEAVKDNLATLLAEASEVTALGHPPPLPPPTQAR